MGANQQYKLLVNAMLKYPKFASQVINYLKNFTQPRYMYYQVVVKGQPISDQVMLRAWKALGRK